MIKNNLSKIMGELRMNRSQLAKLSGLSYQTIQRLYNDETKSIDFDTLNEILEVINNNSNLNLTTHDILTFISDEKKNLTDLKVS